MSLDVGGNNIEAKGITALANALKGNQNLKSLELGYNPIHEKGAQALADVVKYDLKVGQRRVRTYFCTAPDATNSFRVMCYIRARFAAVLVRMDVIPHHFCGRASS